MNRGRIVVEGKPGELKEAAGEKVLQISSIPGNYGMIKISLEPIKAIRSCSINEMGLKVTLSEEVPVQDIIDVFESHGEKIKCVDSSSPSLEDVFIHAAGEAWH
jgi:ABC-type uncharacterized transport system ATPase subunit